MAGGARRGAAGHGAVGRRGSATDDDHHQLARHDDDLGSDDDHTPAHHGNDDLDDLDDQDDPPRPTTTSTTNAVTTTTKAASSSSSSTVGWVLLAVVIVLAVLLVVWLIARNRRQGRAANWRRSVTPAIAAAELARELVLSQAPSDDQQRRATVGVQVDEAVDGLERAASSAPDETSAALTNRTAQSLRGLAFAVEADHLLRSGGEHPTGQQLASADAARRNSSAEFDVALRDLKAAVTPTK